MYRFMSLVVVCLLACSGWFTIIMVPYIQRHCTPRCTARSSTPPSTMGNRKKAANDPSRRAPGPTGWVVGTKKAFLDRHAEEFKTTNDRGTFYDRVTTGFMMKYGPGFDLSTDLEEDGPDPDSADMTEDYSDLTEEEVVEAKAYRKRLRSVSHMRYTPSAQLMLVQKIGQYYRSGETKIKALNSATDIPKLFMDHAQAQAAKLTVPVQVVQYYSTLYYSTRIKPAFEAAFTEETEKAERQLVEWAGVDPPAGWSRPKHLPVRNRVTAECWNRETQSFKDSVTAAHKEEVERQRAAFASAMELASNPTTPEEFQQYVHSI